jgi:hypothetical protein
MFEGQTRQNLRRRHQEAIKHPPRNEATNQALSLAVSRTTTPLVSFDLLSSFHEQDHKALT